MKKLVVIDSNAIGWAIFHALPALSHAQKGTAIIYGFLHTLMVTLSREQPDLIALIWDGSGSKRQDIFPEYKAKRRAKKKDLTPSEKVEFKDMMDQFRVLRDEILPALGFANVLSEDGYEGDDLIASITKKYTNYIIRVVARDFDLYQLITQYCTIYDHVAHKIIDNDYIYEKYGIWPDMWGEMKSMSGCVTDEVPGIKGVGNTTAIKYMQGGMKTTGKVYKRIVSSSDVIEFTKKLVVLPFEGTPEYDLKPDNCTVKAMKKVAKKYGLDSLATRSSLRDFRRICCEKTETNTNSESRRTSKKVQGRTPKVFRKKRK